MGQACWQIRPEMISWSISDQEKNQVQNLDNLLSASLIFSKQNAKLSLVSFNISDMKICASTWTQLWIVYLWVLDWTVLILSTSISVCLLLILCLGHFFSTSAFTANVQIKTNVPVCLFTSSHTFLMKATCQWIPGARTVDGVSFNLRSQCMILHSFAATEISLWHLHLGLNWHCTQCTVWNKAAFIPLLCSKDSGALNTTKQIWFIVKSDWLMQSGWTLCTGIASAQGCC